MIAERKDEDVLETLYPILQPFNRNRIEMTGNTEIVNDLDLDSLAVMELVAAVEDRFDINVPLNMLPDIRTVSDLASAIVMLQEKARG